MVACTKRFDYPFASIGDLEVRTMTDPKIGEDHGDGSDCGRRTR